MKETNVKLTPKFIDSLISAKFETATLIDWYCQLEKGGMDILMTKSNPNRFKIEVWQGETSIEVTISTIHELLCVFELLANK